MKKTKSEYKIPNCTPNQLIKFLKALKDGEARQDLINVLVEDKDAHHQRDMAIRFGLAEKSGEKYVLTDFGEHIVLIWESDELALTFREKCIPLVPIFRDMLRIIKLSKQMTRDELKDKLVSLVKPVDWSPKTLDQYVNLVIGYFRFAGIIEYQKRQKIIKYIL